MVSEFKRRDWEIRANAEYHRRNQKTFLAFVTPGGGKTRFALQVGEDLLKGDQIRQIVVVVHTHNLRLQWQAAAAEMGLRLSNNISRSGDHDGFVVTYQQVADDFAGLWIKKAIQGSKRTLVICDE